uniref:SAP domain-containing protein n=1 Tax=Syphacia muris TaxID=451379 RepID=A0A0N5AA29_9BILA
MLASSSMGVDMLLLWATSADFKAIANCRCDCCANEREPSNADPLIQTKAEVLKRCKLKDSLNRKLQRRPGPLELVTKKILQADAELEQAIQVLIRIGILEGRLLFTRTTDLNENGHNSQHASCYIPGMEVIATPTCSHQSKVANICKARFRKRSHQNRGPYEQSVCSPAAQTLSKFKLQDNKEASLEAYKISDLKNDNALLQPCSPNETIEQFDDLGEAHSSYDLLLHQQHLYLQWQKEVENSKSTGSVQQDDAAGQNTDSSCVVIPQSSSEVSYQVNNEYQESASYQNIVSPSSDSSHTAVVTPVIDTEKLRTKLSDYRVQDLKNECKKRQLPVSGSKPQLLERLKPYEDDILGSTPTMNSQEIILDSVTAPSPASESSIGSSRLPPISNVINDYIQQNVTQHPIAVTQQQPVLVQIPASSQQQVLHLVASNGAIIANTTVPSNMQCYCIAPDYAATTNEGSVGGSRIIAAEQLRTESGSQPTATVQYIPGQPQPVVSAATEPTFSFAQLGSGGQFTLVQTSSSSPDFQAQPQPPSALNQAQQQLVPSSSTSIPTTITTATGKAGQVCQTTTSCIQAGGPQMMHVCGHLQAVSTSTATLAASPQQVQTVQTAQQQSQQQSVTPGTTSTLQAISATPTVGTSTVSIVQNAAACTLSRPLLTNVIAQPQQSLAMQQQGQRSSQSSQSQQQHQLIAQPQQITATTINNYGQKSQLPYVHYVVGTTSGTQQIINQDVTPVSQRALCPPMQAALSSAECSPIVADSASESSNVPSPQEAYNKATAQQDLHQINIDPNDTNALLSATTLSIHEEMLRFQQRKIDELQRELHRSQQQLKHQQQVILAAKKAQQKKRQDEEDDQKSQAEIWLRQLDINKLNKFHIQLFVQHKKQQQQLQAQISEHEVLATTEQKLQEELHVEQAVQDIVRLIRQDARTALLIVQLLRRYQLERNQELVNAVQAAEEQNTSEQAQLINAEAEQPNSVMTVQEESPQLISCSEQQPSCSPAVVQYNNAQQQSQPDISSQMISSPSPPSSKPKTKKKLLNSRGIQPKAELKERKEKSSPTIDMEEIFRKVLEDASRALMNDSEKSTSAGLDYVSPGMSPHSVDGVSQSQQPQQQQLESQKPNEQSQVQQSQQSEAQQQSPQQTQYIIGSTIPQSDSCKVYSGCGGFMQPKQSPSNFNGTPVVNSMESSEDRYEERVEVIEENATVQSAVNTSYQQYSKNQAFDDLMDVLRDDQAGVGEPKHNDGDYEIGNYGSDELASLLGEDWMDHDSTVQTTPGYTQDVEQPMDEQPSPEMVSNSKNSQLSDSSNKECTTQVATEDSNDQGLCMEWLDMMLPSPDQNSLPAGQDQIIVGNTFG